MIWFLIICTDVYGGTQCLPVQEMPSREACEFVGKGYKDTHYGRQVSYRCRGVRKA